jgi:hypothetical protein
MLAANLDIFTNLLHQSNNIGEIGVSILIRFKRLFVYNRIISSRAILVIYQQANNM